MRRYFHISRWLLSVMTLCIVVTVVTIPLVSALHSHEQYTDHCRDKQKSDGTDTGGATDCDFCALYAQFTPREALPVPLFSFRAPVTSLLTVFIQPRSKAPCKGLVNGYATRAPPVVIA